MSLFLGKGLECRSKETDKETKSIKANFSTRGCDGGQEVASASVILH